MEEEKFQSYWTVIPTKIFEDERTPLRAKKLYGLISSLTKKDGYCWASNNYLTEKSRIPLGTVRRYLKLLQRLKYIHCEISKEEGNERKIWLVNLVEKPVEKEEKLKDPMFTITNKSEHSYAHSLDRNEHKEIVENKYNGVIKNFKNERRVIPTGDPPPGTGEKPNPEGLKKFQELKKPILEKLAMPYEIKNHI